MATTEIPASYRHVCDCCGAEKVGAKTRPDYWSNLTLARDAYDYQGAAVADGTVKLLLCKECSAFTVDAINTRSAALKSGAPDA